MPPGGNNGKQGVARGKKGKHDGRQEEERDSKRKHPKLVPA
jgi:hypothetical protein